MIRGRGELAIGPPPGVTERVTAERVLVVAPHYDDEVLGCGGLLAQLSAAGARIEVLFLTDGSGAGEPGTGEAYGKRRAEEAERVATVLGVGALHHAGLPDGALDAHVEAAAHALEACLEQLRPDLVLAPSPLEVSSDHVAACRALHRVLGRSRLPEFAQQLRVLLYEVNHAMHPDLLVDVSAEVPRIEAAMACYASEQARHDYLGAALGLRRYRTLTLTPAVTHAEAYRRLEPADLALRSFAELSAALGGRARIESAREGPLVSVIVRTHDRPELLAEALASVAAGSYRSVEIVLVSDGGPPGAVPADYPLPVRRVDWIDRRGRAAAAQAGIEAAHGDYVAFLDDDDLFAPEHVDTLVALACSTGARVAYTDAAVGIYEVRPDGHRACVERRLPYSRDFDRDWLLVDNYIPFNTVLVERELLAKVGPVDEGLEVFEDWDLLIRLAAEVPFRHLPRVTCEYRHFRGATHHALAAGAMPAPDFLAARARILGKHWHSLDPPLLSRVVTKLREEAVQAGERLDAVTAELRRVSAMPPPPVPLESPAPPAPLETPATPVRRVAVLLANWDGREHLETCLQALSRQRDPGIPWDVWVFDNGSRDGSLEWLRREHPGVRVLASPVNVGFSAANNRLAEAAADADALAMINNDTRPREDWLAELVAALQAAPGDVAAVAGVLVDWSGERLDFGQGLLTFDGHAFQQDFRRPLAIARVPESGAELLFACAGNMLVRRSSFLEAGGFDERYFAYTEDVDLGWRLWSCGQRVLSAPRAVAAHRSSATSDRLGLYNRGFLFEKNAFLTAYKNYDSGLWERLMPAILLTLLSRTMAMAVANNPGGALLTIDPFGNGLQNGTPGLLERLLVRSGFGGSAPRLTDERTVAQLRALHWVLRRLDEAAEDRAAVQRRRRRPDDEIFERFPLHLVPTYPGDDELFRSPGFRAWLPEHPPLVFRTLSQVMEP
jgi:GT2 family glycosyltransferase/LmbE family N-acetylglucosaminyl deacetylase